MVERIREKEETKWETHQETVIVERNRCGGDVDKTDLGKGLLSRPVVCSLDACGAIRL
jgi:hypothetical protein